MNRDKTLQLADLFLGLGQTHKAVEELRKLLASDPENASAHAMLAHCLIDQKRLSAADHESATALALDANGFDSLYARALVCIYKRDFPQAGAFLESLLAIAPLEPEIHRLKAQVFNLTGKQDQVLSILEHARTLDPEDLNTKVQIARFHIEKGDLNLAEPIVSDLLNDQPEHRDALILMGHILLKKGNNQEAYDHAVWALRQDPSDVQAIRLLAAIKARQSWLWGFWWRFNAKLSELGETKAIVILLGMFVVYRLATIFADQIGNPGMGTALQFLWLAFCIYSWVGPEVFKRNLQKEIGAVNLNDEF